jgi:hypothetical protein
MIGAILLLIIVSAVLGVSLLKGKRRMAETSRQLETSNMELDGCKEENARLLQKVTIAEQTLDAYKNKYTPLINMDEELEKRREELANAGQEILAVKDKYQRGHSIYENLMREIELYQETLDMGSYGLFKPKFNISHSEKYKQAIELNYQKQKEAISSESAAICTTEWSVGGSVAEGKKMTKRYIKLMLYAFNGECDALIAKVKWNNATKTIERIKKAYESINKLGTIQSTHITSTYLNLKLDELALSYEYELKKNEEKEEQRLIREQMREEEKAQKEFERAQKDAEDEEKRYQKALDKAKSELGHADQADLLALNQRIAELEHNLQEAHERKERAISQAQMTKVGHIYVISNIGSFGEGVYKIGMTRRLDPHDRIRELGDASVPFQFDVHAIIYSENAPQLENELHKKFGERRMNRINNRKEFFKISLEEVEEFVNQHANASIEITKLAEAKEYRETLNLIENTRGTVDLLKADHLVPGFHDLLEL